MKKFLVIITMICLVLGLSVIGSGEANKAQKTVSILTPYLSSVTTNEMVGMLKTQAANRGWKTNVVDTKGDFGELASRMEDVISAKVDAIVLVSTDPNLVRTQIKDAAARGIPVFGCDSGFIEGMTVNATSDNAAMSKMITEYLIKQLGGKGRLIVLTYRPHPGVLKRTLLLDEILKKNPGIQVVVEQQVQVPGPIENSRKQMESLLLANKKEDSITAVWCGWDEPAIGATQAIMSANRKNIVVTGIDGTSQAVEMIKKGTPLIATVKQNFSGMAEVIIKQIALVFQNKKVEGNELYVPGTLITKANASK
jgi:ribose transport system substrate-binding protein